MKTTKSPLLGLLMKNAGMRLALCLSFPVFAQTGAETKPPTNEDIVKLAKLDLPPSAIISKIKNTPTHFDVGVDALVDLKSKGVSGEVISEMIDANTHEQKVAASQKDMRDPATFRKEGIYYYNKHDSDNLFVAIDATVISNSKSGGFGTRLAQHYSYGIAKNKHISSLSSAHSKRQIHHSKPRFYFYINRATNISPNMFALVKLTENDDSREMVIAKSNAYGKEVGIEEKAKVDFGYDQVADGIYKVYPTQALETGEYCFIYTGSAPTIFSSNRVYDFGIDVKQ